ncbi:MULTISPECIES: DUF6787 family protein [Meridianimaribacter]|uniref:DUF6787 domain-containing protein n=1 Tax=Meridianimaribacter flavus TaxID=571115 RepID=A0ABY2G6Z7_9FLAO|nr:MULTISPECIES: DUF6787 family protein [Meridianimaribacter]TBV26740.1 hypothetical protein DMZ43_06650 [Meridianimaribacter sp. CL38]TDY12423.1 hypothetical protein A8975_1187 [Meridianimaribacter flavus]
MKKFKENWEIQHNWQLLFPIIAIVALLYSSYKLSSLFIDTVWLIVLVSVPVFYALLKFFLFLFKKLEKKWILQYKWEMIRVFIVFAITGSTSAYIGKPIFSLLGITKENLNPIVYWVLFIIIGLIFYQLLLVFFGWLFGQFNFFWEFEKKMLRRFGLKRFID